jgi:hypothetical protein
MNSLIDPNFILAAWTVLLSIWSLWLGIETLKFDRRKIREYAERQRWLSRAAKEKEQARWN